jgi:hypothetical protein
MDQRNILLKTAGVKDDLNHYLRLNHSEFTTFAAALPNLLKKMEKEENEVKIFITNLGGSRSCSHLDSDDLFADVTPTHLHIYRRHYSDYIGLDDEMMSGLHISVLQYLPLTFYQLHKLIEVSKKFENVHHAMCSNAGV